MAIKVLVADDEPDVLELIQFRLEVKGMDVVTAPDGFVAVQKAREVIPDVIILDWMMPKMDGVNALKAIKADPRTNMIKVILLTAKNQPMDKFWAEKMGADGYIPKPYQAADLIAMIEKFAQK